jgi:hypothetical protein
MLYLWLIILSVRGDVSIDIEALLVTDFMNLKIKLTQSFRSVHRGRVCVCVFIWLIAHMCMSICICIVFLQKKRTDVNHQEKIDSLMSSTRIYSI